LLMGAATITTDHDDIRSWVEERGGFPARAVRNGGAGLALLRIDFPALSGDDSLERIPWETWFQEFDDSRLAFLLQEETEDGQVSHFNKLVSQESVERARQRARRS